MIAGVVSYMLLCWEGGVIFEGLVSLTSSPYPSPYSPKLFVLGGGLPPGFCYFVRARRLGAFGFLWEREQVCEM